MSIMNETGVAKTEVRHTVVPSVLGDLTVVAFGENLVGLYYPHHWYRPDPSALGERIDLGFEDLRQQVGEYLAGDRQKFEISVTTAGDGYEERVWDLVRRIPYGETTTYGQLARELGDGTSPQEVGAAVGRNPVCLLLPCHRVVGAGGKLSGYAGGLARKRFLLDLEARVSGRATRLF